MSLSNFKLKDVLNTAVVVAALGYFVDVYDLVLFLIVGVPSLKDLGAFDPDMANFQYLLNLQMIGMLVGGLFWGVLGDKKGRLSVLFGSIITYSIANVANGFVSDISNLTHIAPLTTYGILRFIAGFGLAGELGAGVTLVSESMNKETRGYGTMLIASIGVVGAVVAALVGNNLGWQAAYFIGGALGFSLLLLRVGVFESGMYKNMHSKEVKQGNFFFLFANRERAFRYINSILVGLPIWFIIGILVGRASAIAGILSPGVVLKPAYCVMFCYSGLVFGDIGSGLLSQVLKSRKRAFLMFYALVVFFVLVYLNLRGGSATAFYAIIACLGFSAGFWAIFVTSASEQFGTNLRATATTTVPNFVRGSLVPIAFLFDSIKKHYDAQHENGIITAGLAVTLITVVIAALALSRLKESFGKDLDYLEK